MDFDCYFFRVQTILKSLERKVGVKLIDFTRDDNDEDIQSVVQLFDAFMKDLNPGNDSLRKINLYLLINSDFEAVYYFQSDINLCHLFNTIPKLSTTLYFEFMINTDLYKFIDEIIISCPEVFVVDVLKCISANIKHTKSESVSHLLYLICKGLYIKVCNLQEQNDKNCIKQKFVKILKTFLEFSIFDLIETAGGNREKKQCIVGHYVKYLLNLIENCIKLFNSGNFNDKMTLYQFKTDFDYSRWNCKCNDDNWPICCLQLLIYKCKVVLKDVSVDIFMAWCEEDYEKDKSLQRAVQEAAYTCREAVHTVSKYEDTIVDCNILISILENFAVKPKNEETELENPDADIISKKMKDPEQNQLKLLKLYLNINNILLENQCIDNLKGVVHVFTKETTLQLIGTFTKHLANGEIPADCIESYKTLIKDCVRKLNVEEQLCVLQTVASEGSDTYKTASFNVNVTETFNKLVNRHEKMDKVMQDVMILALESGRELVTLLLTHCLKGSGLCKLLIQILLENPLLTKYTVSSSDSTQLCMHCTVQHFEHALRTNLEDRDSLVYMIKELSSYNIINGQAFVIKHLIPTIQDSVPLKKWKDIDLCLDIFNVFIDGSGGVHVKVDEAEIIAFLAQLLNHSRLQPPQFTVYSGQVMQKTITCLNVLVKNFINKKNEKDSSWLRGVSKSLNPLSWFPLRKLWTTAGLPLPPDPKNTLIWSKQKLGRSDLIDMNEKERSAFVIQLCKVLPLLSLTEWKMIGFELGGKDKAEECIAVFHILADCLLVLNQLPIIVGNPECMAHLISGFTNFFKIKGVVGLKHSGRKTCMSVINKQIILVNELGPEVIKVRLAALVTVFQDMMTIILDKATEGNRNPDLLSSISSIKEPQIKSMMSNCIVKSLSS